MMEEAKLRTRSAQGPPSFKKSIQRKASQKHRHSFLRMELSSRVEAGSFCCSSLGAQKPIAGSAVSMNNCSARRAEASNAIINMSDVSSEAPIQNCPKLAAFGSTDCYMWVLEKLHVDDVC